MAWGPIWKREGEQERCAEPGCSRRADQQLRCWHCSRQFCRAHVLEQVDERPPRKVLCMSCAARAGWL